MMKKLFKRSKIAQALLAGSFLMLGTGMSQAAIQGITGTNFSLTAKADHISTGDGNSMLLWGFQDDNAASPRAQYPAPTLIVNQGDTITITVNNALPMNAGNISLVFPGQEMVTASGGVAGALTQEAVQDDPATTTVNEAQSVTYTFTATQPGTFSYHSGTNEALQVEMGLTGALIVRPTGFDANAPTAYNHADSAYTREYLFFLSEMDPRVHLAMELDGTVPQEYLDNYVPNYFFINGRTAPDDFQDANVGWLPTQPYNSLPRMHPGDKVLMRVVGGGHDIHPFHHHGNHARIIAENGHLLESTPGAGTDLSHSVFTMPMHPGKTVDGIFEWTGQGLNWDVYGGTDVYPEMYHQCNGSDAPSQTFDPITHEWCGDHGKPFPVVLPSQQDLTFGGWWSGSPYLGSLAQLPPGEGGLNPNGGFVYMWHSHTERELTNFDIYPGGMLTMMIIESYNVPINE